VTSVIVVKYGKIFSDSGPNLNDPFGISTKPKACAKFSEDRLKICLKIWDVSGSPHILVAKEKMAPKRGCGQRHRIHFCHAVLCIIAPMPLCGVHPSVRLSVRHLREFCQNYKSTCITSEAMQYWQATCRITFVSLRDGTVRSFKQNFNIWV